MYTNGLKDRFGSPLLSKKDADALYFDKESSENLQNNFTSHVGNNTHLTETDRKLLSDLANNGSKSYDWTPNSDIKIQFSLIDDYTIPVNGWLVINSNATDDNETWSLSVNDKQLFNSDQRGNLPIQILLSKNDVISTESTTDRGCYFLPCKSEVLDYRVTKTPYDVWANAVVEDENGNLSIQNLYVPDASSWRYATEGEVRESIIRVEDEVAYDVNNNLVCNIQSSEIVNGSYMFDNCYSLTSFSCDLSNLEHGDYMFSRTALTSFSGDLSNLINGSFMFENSPLTSFSGNSSGSPVNLSNLVAGVAMFASTLLTSFDSDLSNLVAGEGMFYNIFLLTTFNSDLSSLVNACGMFEECENLTSFSGDLSNLSYGESMFDSCTALTSFNGGVLSSLLNGYNMFYNTSLNEESIQNIADTIRDISELDKNDDSIWQYPYSLSFNEDGSYTWTYKNINQSQRGRLDLSYDKSITDLTNINNSIAQIKAKGWDVYLDEVQQ